jgi:hypothetical protein
MLRPSRLGETYISTSMAIVDKKSQKKAFLIPDRRFAAIGIKASQGTILECNMPD